LEAVELLAVDVMKMVMHKDLVLVEHMVDMVVKQLQDKEMLAEILVVVHLEETVVDTHIHLKTVVAVVT
tara:strand:+ start:63 stop:269 length:207 start_codon:yes stop_codon:yes gene_type:complete